MQITITIPDEASQKIAQAITENIADLVKEELQAKTIGVDEFRYKYGHGKGRAWVDRFIFKKFNPDWYHCLGQGRKAWIDEYPAAQWMKEHKKEVDWSAKFTE